MDINAIPLIRARLKQLSYFVQIRADWLAKASALPGRSLHFANMLMVMAARQQSATVSPSKYYLEHYQISRDAAGDALTRLEAAGLVSASRRRGRPPRITLLDQNGDPLKLQSQ